MLLFTSTFFNITDLPIPKIIKYLLPAQITFDKYNTVFMKFNGND